MEGGLECGLDGKGMAAWRSKRDCWNRRALRTSLLCQPMVTDSPRRLEAGHPFAITCSRTKPSRCKNGVKTGSHDTHLNRPSHYQTSQGLLGGAMLATGACPNALSAMASRSSYVAALSIPWSMSVCRVNPLRISEAKRLFVSPPITPNTNQTRAALSSHLSTQEGQDTYIRHASRRPALGLCFAVRGYDTKQGDTALRVSPRVHEGRWPSPLAEHQLEVRLALCNPFLVLDVLPAQIHILLKEREDSASPPIPCGNSSGENNQSAGYSPSGVLVSTNLLLLN